MGKIPIISKSSPRESRPAFHSNDADLPLLYMNDYSVVGLVVGDYARAIDVLNKNAVSLTTGAFGRDVHFHDGAALQAIVRMLRKHAIECDMTDLVTQIYQG